MRVAPETRLESLTPYIREAGLQRRDAWRIARRIYDHQFLYCFSGAAHMMLREQYYHITPGHLVIIPPNVPHKLWFNEQQLGELYWFHCDFFLLDDRQWIYDFYNTAEKYITLFGAELRHKKHIRDNPIFPGGVPLPEILKPTHPEEAEYHFRAMHRAYAGGDALWQLIARRSFYAILDIVLRQTTGEAPRSANRAYAVNQIKAYIAKHYFEPMTVADICGDTGLNTEYASKLFRRQTGQKLVEYISRFRVNQAKKLLIDPDLSITNVAEMVGFSNENYFCSVLKNLEGRTPSQLRAHLLSLLPEEEPHSTHGR